MNINTLEAEWEPVSGEEVDPAGRKIYGYAVVYFGRAEVARIPVTDKYYMDDEIDYIVSEWLRSKLES